MRVDLDELKKWIGKTETLTDLVTSAAPRTLNAILDREESEPRPGASIQPCGHWLYFLPAYRQSELGEDGHPRRGGFLPPVPLPRRMWAGSHIEFLRPLLVGATITRTSRIVDVTGKEGRSGPLVFVRVRHEIDSQAGPAVIEEQDIVYREMPKTGERASQSQLAPVACAWTREIQPHPVLLFRYSALVSNSHRIHFDRRYATEVEGYPGLIVQGPLIATLLLDLLRRQMPDTRVLRFSFRSIKPLFDSAAFSVRGARDQTDNAVHLWAEDIDGALCMDATATVAEE